MRSPHHLAFHGKAHLLSLQPKNPRQTEIGDLHTPFAIHEHVLGFDVTVNDSFVMCILERIADLGNDL